MEVGTTVMGLLQGSVPPFLSTRKVVKPSRQSALSLKNHGACRKVSVPNIGHGSFVSGFGVSIV